MKTPLLPTPHDGSSFSPAVLPASTLYAAPPPTPLGRCPSSSAAARRSRELSSSSALAPLRGPPSPIDASPFLRVRTLSSVPMESASTTVPSIVVYVTVPNREAGKKLAESIVSQKLAACVNILPGIESVYWWEGKVQADAEELLIMKTRESLLDALTEHVKANHEYDVPEVIALPIKGGNLKYLEWLKNSTREK